MWCKSGAEVASIEDSYKLPILGIAGKIGIIINARDGQVRNAIKHYRTDTTYDQSH